MTTAAVRNDVAIALAAKPGADWPAGAAAVLAAMGYRSELILEGQTGDPSDFIRQFPADNPGTQTERRFLDAARSVQVLFQITNSEIADAAASSQRMMFDASGFDTGNAQSFLFLAVQLTGDRCSRGQYAEFTREINKRLFAPSVVLFRTASNRLTFAFVHRRPNRRDPDRDVLGNVSLIREIDPTAPHQAHVRILEELTLSERLKWMVANGRPTNFDGLLAAWLNALDTEELNRRFYHDLFQWFEQAVETAKFPHGEANTLNPQEHVIRLITRLMFVWFIKEKGLVADELFFENRAAQLLKDYHRNNGESYYRAVLQNLFFATLNTEIAERRFSKKSRDDHRNFSVYRYEDEIARPDELRELFDRTPFINGGLFDCLDSFATADRGGVRVDCFTDNPTDRAGYSIPNRLFFGGGEPGLIDIFHRYKFTVEENTPAEQEVALDPELLGKVFENLLAAVNPETQNTARKETGSYYTPREVVDYMVDEALVTALAQKAAPTAGDADWWQVRLRYLLDYGDAFDDADTLFTPQEREAIVAGIAGLKVLDPAVGSGAFPMGILHKLTLALRRLDLDNALWKAEQIRLHGQRAANAFWTADRQDRDAELDEISATFEKYSDSDFGRKLYLIQNTIYGADIQPIATQIAKLRFFISLAIEQQPNADPADNYGIKPLPNLETRFVAADTLLSLEKPAQLTLGQTDEVQWLEYELASNRERHFHANNRQMKLDCRNRDKELRQQLAAALQSAGFSAASATQVAAWDAFDQNADAAGWFGPEYMFGVASGFNIVIGNPPYVESRNSLLSDEMKVVYRRQVSSDWGATLPRGSDLLTYFLARTPKLLDESGHGYLITQNAWLTTNYGKSFQDFSLGKFSVKKIVDTSARFFADSSGPNINAVVTVLGKRPQEGLVYEIVNAEMETTKTKAFAARQSMKWGHIAAMPDFFLDMLSDMAARASAGGRIEFGQGINLPLKELNQANGGVPVIVKDVQFVASSADGRISSNRIATTRKGRVPALLMPRGVGDRYYCTLNACKAFSYSHVELYLPDSLWNSGLHYCLWAYMNSSLVWLFREATGRRNLGGGLLKAEATDMKALPVNFDFDFANDAKSVLEQLKSRTPLPIAQEIRTDDHLAIDQMVFDYFGFSDLQEETRTELLAQVSFRTNRSAR